MHLNDIFDVLTKKLLSFGKRNKFYVRHELMCHCYCVLYLVYSTLLGHNLIHRSLGWVYKSRGVLTSRTHQPWGEGGSDSRSTGGLTRTYHGLIKYQVSIPDEHGEF